MLVLLLPSLAHQQKVRSVMAAVATMITDVGTRVPKIPDTRGGREGPGGRGSP